MGVVEETWPSEDAIAEARLINPITIRITG
jgi:hypothetical protein